MRRTMMVLAVAALMTALSAGVAVALERSGGPGDDTLVGTIRADHLDGKGGDHSIEGLGGADRLLIGGLGDDTVRGGAGGDTIVGLGFTGPSGLDDGDTGADTLSGNGDDYLQGGLGPDTLSGGDGGDFVSDGLGDHGSPEDARDTIDGGPGDDVLDGGGGSLELEYDADSSKNVLHGEAGRDELVGDKGDDVLYGGAGDDKWLWGAKGEDVLYGGDGNDFLDGSFDSGERDELYCGRGKDEYAADKNDLVSSSCEKKAIIGAA